MKKSSNNRVGRSARQDAAKAPSATFHDHAAEIASARRRVPTARAVNDLAGLFDVLSNPLRLKIVFALRPTDSEPQPELCVSDLAELLEASESLTSHQLRILREAEMVHQRKEGKLVLYHLAAESIEHVLPK